MAVKMKISVSIHNAINMAENLAAENNRKENWLNG